MRETARDLLAVAALAQAAGRGVLARDLVELASELLAYSDSASRMARRPAETS